MYFNTPQKNILNVTLFVTEQNKNISLKQTQIIVPVNALYK